MNQTAVYRNPVGNSTGIRLAGSLSRSRNPIWPFARPGTIISQGFPRLGFSKDSHTQAL